MCGITAIAGKELNIREYNTDAMLDSLSKRGPDGVGQKSFPHCWLGHRRLSIIDLASGEQPMSDGELTVSFNGEIYNYRELRNELERKGHHFVTHSDTEVILKCFREYGADAPKHLDGMFAFALWDNNQETLLIARDRFGKKPLYYTFDGSTLVLASEIKTLLASGKITGELSYEALDNYLQLMYIPTWKSVYKNIHPLPAAHSGVFKNGKLTTSRYWKLPNSPITISYDDAKAETSRLIHEAVKKRMLAADVEVGSLLSGGVDSSLVSIIAKDFLKKPLKTFSLGYGDYINELPFADQVAKKIGSDHHTRQAGGELIPELEKVISYFDEPHADTSDFPQHLISELAASQVKVALSGDGADEIFMGYGWHRRHHHLSYRSHTIEKVFLDPFQGRIRGSRIFTRLERSLLWGSPLKTNHDIFVPNEYEGNLDPLQKITRFDLTTYMPGQLLAKLDRTSMMHGLEMRAPFLDTALVEFVTNLPEEYKVSSTEGKIILKDLLADIMPKEFVYRKKQGFGAPVAKWLAEPKMKQFTLETLGSGATVHQLFVSPLVRMLLYRFYAHNDSRLAMRVWILLCLEIWLSKTKPKL